MFAQELYRILCFSQLIFPSLIILLNHFRFVRDFFILSKGHAGAGLYVALAEVGFFLKKKLASYYQNGQFLSGHVSHVKVPGVEVSTGSLGHGISIASGIALAKKIEKKRNRIFVLASDGELDEGSSWEAILFASHFKLNNLILIIDRNYLQSIKSTEKTLALEPLKKKFHAFGWNVEYARGHSYLDLYENILSSLSFSISISQKNR